jgi:probable HAF family extracellular repeat protein
MPGGPTQSNGISGNGSTIVGESWFENSGNHAFRWTPGGGYQDLGHLGGGSAVAYGASLDGSVVVGQSYVTSFLLSGFRWVLGTGMQELPMFSASDVSDDGNIVVGMNIRWTAPGQVESLGFLGGNNYTTAHGVSANGEVVVGASETSPNRFLHAFRWTPAGGIQDLGVTDGDESVAWGVSANGQVVYGEARDRDFFWRAFRWTESQGMDDIGTLGGPMSTVHGSNADGSILVGKSLIDSGSASLRAFRWTPQHGMQDLKEELEDEGVEGLESWILYVAADISDDGKVIAGWGYPQALAPPQPWRVSYQPSATGAGVNVKFDSPILHVTPNPITNAGSQVSFRIPNGGTGKNIRLDLYGIDGRRIQTLVDGTYAAGESGSVWLNGEHIASGVYFLQLTSDGHAVESARVQRIR